jgi:carbon-monoxide dehydrogenase small subunit
MTVNRLDMLGEEPPRSGVSHLLPTPLRWYSGIAVHEKLLLRLCVNDEPIELAVPAHKTLLEVLREDLRLTGTKHGCELGECGTCTVLVDGEPVLSCLALPIELQGSSILTVEGLSRDGKAHPLQVAFAEVGAAQCGYCTPGILLAAKALLDRKPRPTRLDIQEALAGNLCRCTGYLQILQAVERAASGEVGTPIRV